MEPPGSETLVGGALCGSLVGEDAIERRGSGQEKEAPRTRWLDREAGGALGLGAN